MTPELVDEMNLEKSFAFYKDRFADASDFTFVFVGSFDLATMKPLVERYLGVAAVASGRKETWKDVGMKPVDGRRREDRARRASSRRARRRSSSPGRSSANRDAARRDPRDGQRARDAPARDAARGAERHLRRQRRRRTTPRSRASSYMISIAFGCNPARTRRTHEGRLRGDRGAQGGRPDREAGERRARGSSCATSRPTSKQNAYLLGADLAPLPGPQDLGEFFTPGRVLQDPRRRDDPGGGPPYLDTQNYVQVTLFPEKSFTTPTRAP